MNQAATLCGVILRQQAIDGNVFSKAWVCDVTIAVGEGQLERFRDDMNIVCRVVAELLQIESFQDVQSEEQHDALGVGSTLVDFVLFVGRLNGSSFLRLIAGEILKPQQALLSFIEISCQSRQRATVERLRPSFARVLSVRARSGWMNTSAGSKGLPLFVSALTELGKADNLCLPLPVKGCRPVGERMALFGGIDGRLDELRQRHGAITLQRQVHATHSAGYGTGVGTGIRYPVELRVELTSSQLGRRTRAVEEDHALFFGDIGEHQGVASNARLMLFYDAGHVEDGNRRIDGIAARLQNFIPALASNGCSAATMPLVPITTGRQNGWSWAIGGRVGHSQNSTATWSALLRVTEVSFECGSASEIIEDSSLGIEGENCSYSWRTNVRT